MMIPVFGILLYFLIIVGGAVFLAVLLWKIVKAHQSIAESMKVIAERMSEKSQS